MPKIEATMSAGFQITVPSAVRKLLDLKPGDKVVFDTEAVDVDAGAKRLAVEKGLTREEQIQLAFAELDRLKEEREKHMTPEQRKFAEMTRGWTASQLREYIDNLPETKAYI